MTTAVPATALAAIQPAFTDAEPLALAGFLAGYRGLTREAYALDLRQFTTWCRPGRWPCSPSAGRHRILRPGAGGWRPGPGGRHTAVVHHRRVLQYAVEEELLGHSPAAHVRRPRVGQPQRARRGKRFADRVRLDQAAGLPPPAPPRVRVTAPQIHHQAAVALRRMGCCFLGGRVPAGLSGCLPGSGVTSSAGHPGAAVAS